MDFTGAGLFNAIGGAAVRAEFMRWAYPGWWNFVTTAAEILSAALIVLPEMRIWGLTIAVLTVIAAIATVIWRWEYNHLLPAVALIALIGIESALLVAH